MRNNSSEQREVDGGINERKVNEGNVDGKLDGIKENLKVIVGMMVDDIWKNYDNYNM